MDPLHFLLNLELIFVYRHFIEQKNVYERPLALCYWIVKGTLFYYSDRVELTWHSIAWVHRELYWHLTTLLIPNDTDCNLRNKVSSSIIKTLLNFTDYTNC